MKLLLSLVFFICLLPGLRSQEIRGKVLNEAGRPASGVTVSLSNKKASTITGTDGHFSLRVKSLPDTLFFSAAGLETYSVVVTEKTLTDPHFEIVLLNDRKALHEVVVVGHGKAGKESARDDGYAAPRVAGVTREEAGEGITLRGISSRASGLDTRPARIMPGSFSNRKLFRYDSTGLKKDTIVYRSHLLTAGEINDFNKWKMWEDFGETEFKTWSHHWNIYAKRRFCVQLQNRQNEAVVSEPVFLVDAQTRDTVWRSFTDNTGKAELWAGLEARSSGNRNYDIVCGNYPPLQAPAEFENGINRMQIHSSCSVSKEVQMAFVVDATGSMGDEIEFLKLELEDVIRKSFEDHKELQLKVASVFYRDRSDEYLTRKIGFQTELLKVLNFIKLQKAMGGGDKPEAVHSALREAIDSLDWNPSARSRILFLVLDAPPHDEDKADMLKLTVKAAGKGIRIVPIVCSGSDKSTEYLMRVIALATNGSYVFLTDHSGIGLPHEKPTTDAFSVELFNALLKRLIGQMVFANDCGNPLVKADPKNLPPNILQVKIFPNPTQGQLTIATKEKLKQVFVTDFTGKILMRLQPDSRQDQWKTSIAGYPQGTYLIKYITEDDRWGAEKVALIK